MLTIPNAKFGVEESVFEASANARNRKIDLSEFKLLRVISSMDPRSGGPAQGIRNSVPSLELLGCANEVVCLGDSASKSSETVGFPIHCVGEPYGAWGWNSQLTLWLGNHLCEYDAVIVHGLWQYQCYAVTKAIRRLKIRGAEKIPRVFVMPHGMLDPWFQNARSRFWKAWRNWIYWKAIEHRTVSQADGLLFTCEQELILARNTFRPYAPKQEHNVGYGIAAPPAQSALFRDAFLNRCPELGDRPYLLYLGRLHEKKGIDLLLNAYARVASQASPGAALPALVVAGPNEGVYAKQMEQLWAGLKQSLPVAYSSANAPAVHFTGMLQGDAKWGTLYGCDAMVLASHQENFGIAIVEAMACGKPVLISNKVNICMEIEQDGAGWVEPDTVDGIFTLIQKWLAADGETRSLLGMNAKRCYEKYYQADNAAKRLLAVLRG